MYASVTDERCFRAPGPFFATMSTAEGEYWVNEQNTSQLMLVPIPHNQSKRPRSVCYRALSELWRVLNGRGPTKSEREEANKHMYLYVPENPDENHPTIVHLTDARPDPHFPWARVKLLFSGGSHAQFLFKANTAFIKHVPMLQGLRSTAWLGQPRLEQFRLRLITEIIDPASGGFERIQQSIKDIQKIVMRTLDDMKDPESKMPEDVLEEMGKASLWRRFAPDTAEWFDAQSGQLLAQGHQNRSAMVYWIGQHLKPADVTDMIKDISWMVGAQKALIQATIMSYFSQTDRMLPVNLNMDMGLMSITKHDGARPGGLKTAMLRQAIAGSGVFMVKLMQQMAAVKTKTGERTRRGCTPMEQWLLGGCDVNPETGIDFNEISKDVFNAIPPMTPEERDKLVQAADSPLFNNIKHSIGSASIAEVYLTEDEQQREVVLKYLRVHYALYFIAEVDMILRVAWGEMRDVVESMFPNISAIGKERMVRQGRQLLLFLINEFADEFDYSEEFENIKRGTKIYHRPKEHVRVAKGYEVQSSPFPYIVQELVPGHSLAEYVEKAETLPQEQRLELLAHAYRLQDTFSTLWMDSVLFGNGEFHADAHMGNLRIHEGNGDLYVIDFGSYGKLSKRDQCTLFDAIIASSRMEGLGYAVPGHEVDAMAGLLLRKRAPEGYSVTDVAHALHNLDSRSTDFYTATKLFKLTRIEQAELIAEATRPLTANECKAADSLRALQIAFRYDPMPDFDKIYDELRKTFSARWMNDDVCSILLSFRNLATFTPGQIKMALRNLQTTPKMQKSLIRKHRANLEHSMDLLQRFQRACSVQRERQNAAANLRVAQQMITYHRDFYFGGVFMDFILFSPDIADCSSNAVALFGRGSAYVGGILDVLYQKCGDASVCPWNDIAGLVQGHITGSIGLMARAVRAKRGGENSCPR